MTLIDGITVTGHILYTVAWNGSKSVFGTFTGDVISGSWSSPFGGGSISAGNGTWTCVLGTTYSFPNDFTFTLNGRQGQVVSDTYSIKDNQP